MGRSKKDYPVFPSRTACENHEFVKERLHGKHSEDKNILNYRIPILWHEHKDELITRKALIEWGDKLFGSVNAVIALRSIAKAGGGKYWIPFDACSTDAKEKALNAYSSDKDYSYADNNALPIGGSPSLTVEEFVSLVKSARDAGGGKFAFYLIEVTDSSGTHWKTGMANDSELALTRLGSRRRVSRIKDNSSEVKWHCLVTNLADKKLALSLEKAVENTFGDICRRWEKKPDLRFGREQFFDHPRIREAAKLLRPISNHPKKFNDYFSS